MQIQVASIRPLVHNANLHVGLRGNLIMAIGSAAHVQCKDHLNAMLVRLKVGMVTIDLGGKGANGSARNAGLRVRCHIMFFGKNGFYGVKQNTLKYYLWMQNLR